MNTIVCRFLVYIRIDNKAIPEDDMLWEGVLTIEEAFGLTLQDLRKTKKLSQEDLGFESGYHRTYISQLERGRKSPSLKTIFQLAEALKTSPSEMVLSAEKAMSCSGKSRRRLVK